MLVQCSRRFIVVGLCSVAAFVTACTDHVLIAENQKIDRDGGVDGPEPSATSMPDAAASPDADRAVDNPGSTVTVADCDWTPATGATQRGMCQDGDWCWENPIPFGIPVLSGIVSAPGANGTWVMSQHHLLHEEGGSWVNTDVPLVNYYVSAAVMGPDDIWVEGYRTNGAVLLHFDGQGWSEWPTAGHIRLFTPATSVLLGYEKDAQSAYLVRFNGTSWERLSGSEWPLASDEYLTAAFVVGADDVWMATQKAIYHFLNGSWAVLPFPQGIDGVGSIWGSAGDNVWLGAQSSEFIPDIGYSDGLRAGNVERRKAALLHWDGGALSPMSVPDVTSITAIGGTASTDVWFGTDDGELLHYDGAQLSYDASFRATRAVIGFDAKSSTDVTAILYEDYTGGVIRWDGAKWDDASSIPTMQDITAVWGSSASDQWVVGTHGLKWHFDGSKWQDVSEGNEHFSSIWGTARDNIWAVTEQGTIQHYDGEQWSIAYRNFALSLGSIWGTGPENLWILAKDVDEQVYVAHYDRGDFTATPVNLTLSFSTSYEGGSIWASSDHDVWAVSDSVVHFDGEKWQDIEPSPGWVGGAQAVWGRGPNDVYVSAFDQLRHYDGTEWTATSFSFPGAIGGCGDYVWVATEFDGVYIFDGADWSPSLTEATAFNAVWGSSPEHLLAVGDRGAVIRRVSNPSP